MAGLKSVQRSTSTVPVRSTGLSLPLVPLKGHKMPAISSPVESLTVVRPSRTRAPEAFRPDASGSLAQRIAYLARTESWQEWAVDIARKGGVDSRVLWAALQAAGATSSGATPHATVSAALDTDERLSNYWSKIAPGRWVPIPQCVVPCSVERRKEIVTACAALLAERIRNEEDLSEAVDAVNDEMAEMAESE